jgi:hypothetical protein
MPNDDEVKTYRGNPERDRKMQEIYSWSDAETDAEAAGKDLHEFGRFKTSVVQIRDEFPEIWSNADLSARAAEMDEQLVRAGDKRPYLDRYRDICTAIHSGGEVTAQGGTTVSEEWRDLARSVQMGNEDEAALALQRISRYTQANAPQQEDSEEGTSETIERMRQSRLPNAFRG